MMNRKVVVVLIAVAIAVIGMPAIADSGPDGAALYKSKCAMCHGPDGSGNTPTGKAMKVRDLKSAEVKKMSDKEIATVISDGKAKMPAYKGKLSTVEIEALVDFVKKLK
jgi:cytochrome c6